MVLHEDKNPEPGKTTVLYNPESIVRKTLETFSWVKKSVEGSIDRSGPAIHVLFEPVWNGLNCLKEKGVKIRLITEVTAENVSYCKKLCHVCELRHLDGVRTNFGIADGKEVLLHGVSQGPAPLSQAIVTTVQAFVEAQQFMFENLWNKAIPAEQKIREIEQGFKPYIIETIADPTMIQNLYLHIVKSAATEVMIIIPTTNTVNHHADIGLLQTLKEIVRRGNGKDHVSIRILAPFLNDYSSTMKKNPHNPLLSSLLSLHQIQLRDMEMNPTTKSIIVIVDKRESLVIEIKDDSVNSFAGSIGFATYSNSRATVLSYVSVFESFWKQSELLKKLKESEELQKDFVHIAAHELKNPIQPILLLSEQLMKHKVDEKEFHHLLKIINRNARKLVQLTNDILDVTKIETGNLGLNKELFNLADLVSEIIEDYRNRVDIKTVRMAFLSSPNKLTDGKVQRNIKRIIIPVMADKNRINQVISNLLSNATRYTTQGSITVILEKKHHENKVFVSVKDTGIGIDPAFLPRLFSKFATTSTEGTGLGLFISKKIVEMHGGQIWAQNNEDGKGATFSFSLPVTLDK